MLRLAWIEMHAALHTSHGEINNAQVVLGVYRSILRDLESIEPRTPLLLEVIARAHRGVGEACLLTGQYADAELEVAVAILIADGLEMTGALGEFRLFQSRVRYHLGRLNEALLTSKDLFRDPNIDLAWRSRARSLHGTVLVELGDDDAAIGWFQEAFQADGQDTTLALLNYALARSGRGGEGLTEEQYRPYLSNEAAVFFRCDQLLLSDQGRPSKQDLREIQRVVGAARPESSWIKAQMQFYRSLAALRLGELGQAIRQCPDVGDFSDEFYGLKTMIHALRLEITMKERRQTELSLIDAATSLERYFATLPPRPQHSLARRIKLFLPHAGAFMAFSPFASPEFKEVCGEAVIEIGKRISVFGQHIQPIHAGVVTLRDFGCRYSKKLNDLQSRQERDVMLQPCVVGGRLHWFQAVSPAFLIFQYLRAHEEFGRAQRHIETSPWMRAAQDLHASNGLMPHPRGFEIEQRRTLEMVLDKMLSGLIRPSVLNVQLALGLRSE